MGLKLDGELAHDVAQIGVKIAAEMLERTRVQRKAARVARFVLGPPGPSILGQVVEDPARAGPKGPS